MKWNTQAAGRPQTTAAPVFKLSLDEVVWALMLSEYQTDIQLTRADADVVVREELQAFGLSRLINADAHIGQLSPDVAQERYDWARVQLLKSWGELHGTLPAVLPT